MPSISFGPRFPASAASDGGNIDLTGDHSREPDYDYVQRGTVESLRARIAALEAEVKRLTEALRLARGALKIAHKNAGKTDPHYLVLDVTRIEIERIGAALAASSEGQTSGGSRVTATDNRPKCVGEPNGSPCYYPPHDGDYCVYHHHRYSDQRAVQDATSGGPRADDGEG